MKIGMDKGEDEKIQVIGAKRIEGWDDLSC